MKRRKFSRMMASELAVRSGTLGVAALSGGLGVLVAGVVACAKAGEATKLAPTMRVVVSSR